MNHFFWSYLPFWIWAYGLAVVAWTCLGRFLLSFMVPPDSGNYIWRGFRFITDWAIALIRIITPNFIRPRYMPLVTMYWFFAIRYASFPVLYQLGWMPTVQGSP